MGNKVRKADEVVKSSRTIRKRLINVLIAILLSAGLIITGIRYSHFASRTINAQSTAHLTEIYRQANQSLHNMVDRKWGAMHMWTAYIRDAST